MEKYERAVELSERNLKAIEGLKSSSPAVIGQLMLGALRDHFLREEPSVAGERLVHYFEICKTDEEFEWTSRSLERLTGKNAYEFVRDALLASMEMQEMSEPEQ